MPTLSARRPSVQPIPTDADGILLPSLIPLAAYLRVEGYTHQASGEVLRILVAGYSPRYAWQVGQLELTDLAEVERLWGDWCRSREFHREYPCRRPAPVRGGAPDAVRDFAAAMAADDPAIEPIAESFAAPEEWDGAGWDAACEAHDRAMGALEGERELEPEALSFVAWILSQAALIRSGGSDAAEWLAAHLELIAGRARFVGATTPAQYDDRCEALESGR